MSTFYITACTVANRGTSSRHAVRYTISTEQGYVWSDSKIAAKDFEKPEAVDFVRRHLAAGDEVRTWHQVGSQTYSEPVRVREGKAAADGSKPAWLQTISDGIWNDNLYSLPDVS